MKETRVGEIMTSDLITVHQDGIVSEVVDIFNDHSFHHLPVIDDGGKLTGILSLTDIDRMKTGASLFKNPNKENYDKAIFQTMWIRDVMTKNITELTPSDSIFHAFQIFKNNQFRALPVVDQGVLKGILTPLDILDYFFSN